MDLNRKKIGKLFQKAATELGLETVAYFLPERRKPLRKIPVKLQSLIPSADVAIILIRDFDHEFGFRVALITELLKYVSRVLNAPGINYPKLISKAICTDYEELRHTAIQLTDLLIHAESLHLTSAAGSDLFIDVHDRLWQNDVVIPEGSYGNILCGEIWCEPIEVKINGTLVCDGIMSIMGYLPEPITLEIEYGEIKNVECEFEVFKNMLKDTFSSKDRVLRIKEIGLGINPGARPSEDISLAKKVKGTVHIGFGGTIRIKGLKDTPSILQEFTLPFANLEVIFKDHPHQYIVQSGKILI